MWRDKLEERDEISEIPRRSEIAARACLCKRDLRLLLVSGRKKNKLSYS